MRCVIVYGFREDGSPDGIYIGNDGTEAQKASDAAIESGQFKEIRRLSNPMGIKVNHSDDHCVPNEQILHDRAAHEREHASRQEEAKRKVEVHKVNVAQLEAKREADKAKLDAELRQAEAESKRLEDEIREAEAKESLSQTRQEVIDEREAERAARVSTDVSAGAGEAVDPVSEGSQKSAPPPRKSKNR
jgi:hypothetical protein